jgi:hypothetical protein
MPLLNYTTTIAAGKTVLEIQSILAKSGAKAILAEYEKGEVVALSFVIRTQFGDRPFKLPVDTERTLAVLKRQWRDGKLAPRYAVADHAQRVSWRILKDWLEAQLALIETEMVTLDQVLLPYMTTDSGQSVYEQMIARRLALPVPPAEDEAEFVQGAIVNG